MSAPEPQNIKLFCNSCKNDTNHSVKASYYVKQFIDNDPRIGAGEEANYQVAECNGCETVTFRKTELFFNKPSLAKAAFGVDETKYEPIITCYPERSVDWLAMKPIAGLPPRIRRAYREVVDAYNFDLLLSSASGLRSIVEALCNDANIPDKDLNGKDHALGWRIRQLENKKLIPKLLADALHQHKEFGNVALHRLQAPNRGTVRIAIELMEAALFNIFSLGKQLEDMKTKMMKSSDD